ncbi:hypothetical protein FOCG_01078 [Fusarium oxysporum f. sp. radicis-lycopersici 26381]|nr:hypothetical protein FOCG_01078 [Fusarium oxysporum f. sp. radicis-lycopersici 26381]
MAIEYRLRFKELNVALQPLENGKIDVYEPGKPGQAKISCADDCSELNKWLFVVVRHHMRYHVRVLAFIL